MEWEADSFPYKALVQLALLAWKKAHRKRLRDTMLLWQHPGLLR
jgi:hypothetical protein